MSKKTEEKVLRCDLCERKLFGVPFERIQTKADDVVTACTRCAKWIRDHEYAA